MGNVLFSLKADLTDHWATRRNDHRCIRCRWRRVARGAAAAWRGTGVVGLPNALRGATSAARLPSRQEAGRDPRTAPQTARAERWRHQAIYWYCTRTTWGDVACKVLPRGCAPFPRPTSAAPSTLDCAFAGGKGVVSSSPTSRKQTAAGSLLVHNMLDLYDSTGTIGSSTLVYDGKIAVRCGANLMH